jgi:hypothetical protein
MLLAATSERATARGFSDGRRGFATPASSGSIRSEGGLAGGLPRPLAPGVWRAGPARALQCLPIVVGTVAFLALIPAVALAAHPAAASRDEPQGVRLTTAATTERIPLPKLRGPVQLTVDALSRRIRLVPSKKDNATALAAKLRAHVGMLCPTVTVAGGAVELGCRSRRVEAQLSSQGSMSYLDINELRGLPWRQGPDAPPSYHFDPWKVGLGQGCPGRTPGVKGECAYKRGEQLEAAMQFRAALDTSGRQLACVRLGDLATATNDPVTAAGWYRRAGAFGVFGRIADGRLCELNGYCLDSTENVLRAFDASGSPEPVRAELLMRAARAEAYAGRLPSAAHIIAKQARDHGMASICREGGELLCRRLLLEAMREAPTTSVAAIVAREPPKRGEGGAGGELSTEAAERAVRAYDDELLEAYLNLPGWEKGPLAYELAQAAAPLAMRLGAPGFAGNLLASLAPVVPDAQLSEHLLQAAETFLRGQNWARARLVADYARSRLAPPGPKGTGRGGKSRGNGDGERGGWSASLASPRWAAVFRRLNERAEEEVVSPEVRAAIEAEVATTVAEIKNARGAIENAEDLLASAKAAKAATPAKPATTPAATTAPAPKAEKPTAAGEGSAAVARHDGKPEKK